MEDTLQKILKKLDTIETRLDAVEVKSSPTAPATEQPIERDPLFDKAVAIINKIDSEISTSEMQKQLGVDFKRAEKILDQLADAGFGTTYMGEA